MVSIINERKNHANFQLIIITHDENFLRKLGQGDVMDYYWYVYPKLAAALILILGSAHSTGGSPVIHGKNPSLRGRDLAKVTPRRYLVTSHLLRAIFRIHCIFIFRIHVRLIAPIVKCTKECING